MKKITDSRITFRRARREESAEIAALIISAWPVEDFLKMSPELDMKQFVSMVENYVRAENTIYSYRNTVAAVLDGAVAGAVVGYDGAAAGELKRPVLEDLERRFGHTPFADAEETGEGEFYVDSIAVSPRMRSAGIGSALLRTILLEASVRGHETAGLLVDKDNPAAAALYSRLGFKAVGTKFFLGHEMTHMQIIISDLTH